MNKILSTKSIIAVSVAIVTFIVYLPTLQNEFINWDDNTYVYDNYFIRSLHSQFIKSAFLDFHALNWHPLTWFSHALDYALWGLNPLGHHLTNNILHALNTLVVVFLVFMLMEVFKKSADNAGLTRPFLNDRTIKIAGAATGLLFGLHPLHVESVAWIAERKDLLCAFFYLLTLIAYTNYAGGINAGDSRKSTSVLLNKNYLLALGFFCLSLLSKPMAVSLPLVLLILDWYLFRRIRSPKTFLAAFIEKIPFVLFSLVSSLLTILAQKAGKAMVLMKVVPLPTRLLVAAKSLIAYLGKMMLPFNLSPYYPYPHPQSISPFSLEYMIPLVIVITITVTCLVLMRNRKFLISVWSYYVITMVPVLGIVQVGDQAMADRYTYLPSLGPFLIAGLLSARVYERAAAPNRPGVLMRTAGFFVATTMLLAMAYTTSRQIGIWKNSVVFWNYVIDKESSGIPFAYSNLGEAYESKGQLDTAIKNYEIALRLKPDYAEAYNNLGAAYQSKGLFDKAIEHYRATLRLKPDDAVVYFNLGAAFASKGDFDTAIKHYEAALRLQPNFAEAHFGIGWSYLKKGFKDMAQKEYELGLAMKPDDYNARQVLISLIPQ